MTKQFTDEEARRICQRVDCANPPPDARKEFQALAAVDAKTLSQLGDALAHVKLSLLRQSGTSFLGRETLELKLAEMWKELGGATATMEEKLLIDAICLAWLRLSLIEHQYSQTMPEVTTFKAGLYWEKRLDSAQKRYRKAIESLARVRRLLRKDIRLQINLATDGGQQINAQT